MVTSRALPLAAALWVALGATLGATAPAHGQPYQNRREAASRAIDDVRYERAQELLGDALREGDNSPAEMVEIYTLAAYAAIVLGKQELGELYYRRLLCIDPRADLDPDLAPKFRRSFAAARAYVSAHGALRVRARRQGNAVEVVVESDPLAMVAAVALRGPRKNARLDAERRAVLLLTDVRDAPGADSDPSDSGTASDTDAPDRRDDILLLDELGNALQVLPLPAAAELRLRNDPAAAPSTSRSDARASRPGLLRTWWIWTLPAAASLTVAAFAGLESQAASDELDDLLASGRATFGEADALRSRSRSYATLANVSFGAAGLFAVVSGVLLATRPSSAAPATALSPLLHRDGAVGLVVSGSL